MKVWQPPTLGITMRLYRDYAIVLDFVVNGLKNEGFVVATEIDIKDTLKRRLGVDSRPFKVMRVYNPNLTARAHAAVPDAALLPYSVTIAQMEDESVEVSVIDPLSPLTIAANAEFAAFVDEGYEGVRRFVSVLEVFR